MDLCVYHYIFKAFMNFHGRLLFLCLCHFPSPSSPSSSSSSSPSSTCKNFLNAVSRVIFEESIYYHGYTGSSVVIGTMIGCPPFVWRLRWTSQLNGILAAAIFVSGSLHGHRCRSMITGMVFRLGLSARSAACYSKTGRYIEIKTQNQ